MADKEATLLLKIKQTGEAVFDKISAGLQTIGKAGVAAFGAISGIAALAIKNYKEQELAVNKLNQALVNQGIYTSGLSKEYQKYATDLQKVTTYGDEQIVSAQATIQSFIGQNKVTKELTTAILNLAAAKNIDLNSAAQLIGKTIATGTNALQRQGVQMELNGNTTQRLAQVTTILNQKFGGQAEAAAKGMGSIERMNNAVSDLFEALGEKLIPIVSFFTKRIMEMTDTISANNTVMDGMSTIFKSVAQMVIILHGLFEGLGTIVGAVLGTAFGAIAQAMEGNFRQAFETVKSGASSLGTDLAARWTSINSNLDALDQEYIDTKKDKIREEEEMVAKSAENQAGARATMRKQDVELEKQTHQQKVQMEAEAHALSLEQLAAKRESELSQEFQYMQLKLSAQQEADIAEQNRILVSSQNKEALLAAHLKKKQILEDAAEAQRRSKMDMADKFDEFMSQKKVQRATQSMSDLSRMQDSKSKEMVAIGKAAAIAMIITDTARAVMGVWGWAAGIPVVGPGIAAGLSAAIIAYGAEQIGRVTSAQMAEGGIVRASAGGVPAIIGEGGRDEAVIPLEEGMGAMGTHITIVNYGGLLGDETQARELAIALDKELLKLRRANQSLALDSSII